MIQEMGTIKEQIRQFVLEDLAQRKGVTHFEDEESLIRNGVVDSLGIFRIVAFLENTFRIRIGDEEITHDKFGSLLAIERFVISHLEE